MRTNYKAIMLALARKVPWAKIAETYGCSRRTIDRASGVLRKHNLDEDAVTALTPAQIALLFPDQRCRDEEQFLQPDFAAITARATAGHRVTLKVEHHRYLQQPTKPG